MDLDHKKLKQIDPLRPQPTVDLEAQQGCSPFDPPEADSLPLDEGMTRDDFHPYLRAFLEEHTGLSDHLARLESVVAEVRTDSAITPQRFADLCKFFDYFDADVIAHNRREEQELFPILRQRMLERGEHSTAPNPITPVSVLEGEHTQTAQVSTVARSFCALVRHLDDPASRQIVLSVALERCDALIEMMRLHVFREDRIVFVLAQEFLSADELSALSA